MDCTKFSGPNSFFRDNVLLGIFLASFSQLSLFLRISLRSKELLQCKLQSVSGVAPCQGWLTGWCGQTTLGSFTSSRSTQRTVKHLGSWWNCQESWLVLLSYSDFPSAQSCLPHCFIGISVRMFTTKLSTCPSSSQSLVPWNLIQDRWR